MAANIPGLRVSVFYNMVKGMFPVRLYICPPRYLCNCFVYVCVCVSFFLFISVPVTYHPCVGSY